MTFASPQKPQITRNPDLYVNIPHELKRLPQWVLWEMFCDSDSKYWKKIPFNPATGRAASSKKSADWGTFAQVESIMRTSNKYDGIGFVFTENDPYIGIDLDNKKNDPAIRDEIGKLASRFSSYREYSPSRTGFHIIMKGSIPAPLKKGIIEIYSTERYFTMTGDVI
jgi:primase-polymerase (primpol)-like protein